MASYTLDVVTQNEPATAVVAIEEMKDMLRDAGWTETEVAELTFEPVTDFGPGGGWPVVRVTGDDRLMRDLAVLYAAGDEDLVDELMNG